MQKAPAFKNLKEAIRLREKTSGHSVFGPSQIARIIQCPASFRESLKRPLRPSGPAAIHGTMLHDVMEHLLTSLEPDTYEQMILFKKLSEEDQAHVRDCMEFILPLTDKAMCSAERFVSLKSYGIPEIGGTVDIVLRNFVTKAITIIDWKFGGTPVFVENNAQLKCYALGTLLELYPDAPSITTYIAQPVLGYFKAHTYSAMDLMEFAEELNGTIKSALSPEASYSPQRKACQWCAAKNNCRARIDKSYEDTKDIFAAVKQTKLAKVGTTAQKNSVVPIGELVKVLDTLQEVEALARDLRKYFHAEAYSGRPVPGFKLVSGRGSRKFKNETAAFNWLQKHAGVDRNVLFTVKAKSVAQVEKVIGKTKKDPDFKKLFGTVPGAPQLVKEDDKRDALKIDAPNMSEVV